MSTTKTILAAAIVAAGAVGGGLAMRPRGDGADAATAAQAATAPLVERIATLEQELSRVKADRDGALRQGSEALNAALSAQREIEKLRERTDDLYASLGTTGGLAPRPAAKSFGSGTSGAGALAGATPDGAAAPSTDPGLANMAQAARAGDVAAVRQVLDQIKKEDDEKQRAEWVQRRRQMLERRVQDLAQKINLTPQQAERLTAIFEESNQKREETFTALRAGGTPPDPQTMRATMQAVRQEEEQKVQETLSAQQYAEYQKAQEERPQSVLMGPGGPRGEAIFFGGGAAVPATGSTAPAGR